MPLNIGATDTGAAFQIHALRHPPFKDAFAKVLYLPELTGEQLEGLDVLIVTCSSDPEMLVRHKELFLAHLARGKTLVVLGRNQPERWLPGVTAATLPFNYWWWLDPEKEPFDLEVADPDHPLLAYVSPEAMVWHYHGGYELPEGARALLVHKELGKAVYYEHPDYLGGRLILTALDPFYHHGSFFMPNASTFAAGFLRYLAEEGGSGHAER